MSCLPLPFGSYYTKEDSIKEDKSFDMSQSQSQRILRNSATSSRNILMSSLQEVLTKETLIDMEELEKTNMEGKVSLLTQAIMNVNNKFSSVHQMFNDPNDGVNPRLDDDSTIVSAIKDENKQLKKELDITKGLLEKQSVQIEGLRSQLTAMKAKQMKSNITISGLDEEEEENSIDTLTTFFQDKMSLIVESNVIKTAYRLGKKKSDAKYPRLMIASLNMEFKETVLSNRKVLKDKKNKDGKFYSIDTQLPDEWTEQRREMRETKQKAKAINKHKKPEEKKDEIKVVDRQVYVNDVLQTKPLYPPKIQELFPNKAEQDKIDKIKLYPSTTHDEEGSSFQAFAVKSQNLTEIKRAYVKVKQFFPNASHIPVAFASRNGEGYHDDGEHGSAYKMLKVIKTFHSPNQPNIAVFVVRIYSGVHIGPKRHTIIADVIQEALTAAQQKYVNPLHGNQA